MSDQFISAEELASRIEAPNLVILDASWHLPTANRDPRAEFNQQHIPNAQFFDIDNISDKCSQLPHMLPSQSDFAEAVSALGVSNDSEIVVYDSVGLFSAPRCWWTFRVFGHTHIRILEGGLPAWIEAGYPLTAEINKVEKADYLADFHPEYVASVEDVLENCRSKAVTVLDARSEARFYAEAPEPRPGVAGGHIPGSRSLPYDLLVESGSLKSANELQTLFAARGVRTGSAVITSCGSGISAAVIFLALHQAGYGLNRLYDGSWAEWGTTDGLPVSTSKE